MPEFDYMSALSVDGQIRSSAQGKVLGSFAVMPAASALSENAIVLYTGTTGTYVSGQFYMCVNTGSGYEWQPVTISGTEEDTYTADRALVTNSLGQVTASGITATELGYLSGATSPLQAQINGKVTAVSGMGLSQNSYTNEEKNKLAGIAAGAQVNVIEAVQRNGSAVPVSGKTVNISVPVALSELTNDKGFIDSTVENLANFYTKSEVNSLVSTIPKFAVQVVSALPASGQSSTTIYLTPNSGSSGNVYDEYLWVNNAWEKIGSTQVSFTLDQDGNSIVINGTTLKDASSTSAGLMSITSFNDLQTAKSNISSLQGSYSTLNGTVSSLSSRLDTAESTLSTTVSQVSTLNSTVSSLESQVSSLQDDVSQIQPGSIPTVYYGFQHQSFGTLELTLNNDVPVATPSATTMTGGDSSNPGYTIEESIIYASSTHEIQHSIFTQLPVPSVEGIRANTSYRAEFWNDTTVFDQMTDVFKTSFPEMCVVKQVASLGSHEYIDGTSALIFSNDDRTVLFGLGYPLLFVTTSTGSAIPNTDYYQYPFSYFSEFDRNIRSNVNPIPSGTYHLIGVPTNLLPHAPSYVDMPEHIDIGTL